MGESRRTATHLLPLTEGRLVGSSQMTTTHLPPLQLLKRELSGYMRVEGPPLNLPVRESVRGKF